jgi:hypothetical protein
LRNTESCGECSGEMSGEAEHKVEVEDVF